MDCSILPSINKGKRQQAGRGLRTLPRCGKAARPKVLGRTRFKCTHLLGWTAAEIPMKVAIIGGGIVGLATAHQLLERYPSVEVLVLEKEDGAGRHQTGHNSGVLHCGLYYKPGSTKARMAVEGIRRMAAFCEQHNVPYDLCGKTVVATEPEEIPRLHALLERGKANGLEGLQLLGP